MPFDSVPPIAEASEGYAWGPLFLPSGTAVEFRMRGKRARAEVVGSEFVAGGEPTTPSRFARAVAGHARNAWRDLWIRFPGQSEWHLADDLRCPGRARQRAARPVSLVPFLIAAGGLRDQGGEVSALVGGSSRARPGLINNRSGLTLDRAAMLALEAGYFPEHEVDRAPQAAHWHGGCGTAVETMSVRDLLDAIDWELRGRRRWPGGVAPEDEGAEAAAEAEADPEAEAVAGAADAAAWRRVVAILREEGEAAALAFLMREAGVPEPGAVEAEAIPF